MRHTSLIKAVNDFRLRICSVILGNPVNTKAIQSDIDYKLHIAELSEQYSLFIFLNWIAIKHRFPVYDGTIDRDFPKEKFPLVGWPAMANQYPMFNTPVAWTCIEEVENLYEILDHIFEADINIAGEIYQQSLSAPLIIDGNYRAHIDKGTEHRSKGQYYTPDWVVGHALDRILNADSGRLLNTLIDSLDKEDGLKVIDPACGSGNFLLGIIRWLQKHEFTEEQIYIFAGNSLYGKDIDGRALALCRISLLLLLSRYFSCLNQSAGTAACSKAMQKLHRLLEKHICVGDSLIESTLRSKTCEQYDLVLGNPPYISFGARNQPEMNKGWQQYVKKSFPEASEYKIRLHSVFQQIAINMTKAEGQIAFLLPDAFLNGSYYRKLREFILNNCRILSLTELPEDTIANATVGRWCVAHYQVLRGKEMNPVVPSIPLIRLSRSKSGREDWLEYLLPSNLLVSKDKSRFQLLFSDLEAGIFSRLSARDFLATQLRGHTGIRARQGQKSIIAETALSDSYKKALISGSQIVPYHVSWKGDWLHVKPELLYPGGFDERIIGKGKLLVRQTADKLIAAVDESGLYHLNNVHSFALVGGQSKDEINRLHFFCGLLNSSFFLYVYRLKSRESKRALAQIDIEMVESLPLPAANPELEKLIATASYQLHKNSSEQSKLARVIDCLIYELFEISENERQNIEKEIGLSNQHRSHLPSLPECRSLVNKQASALHFSGLAP